MARPSPRTQGVDAEGKTFQKFGTQQLKYIDPAKPALGVVEKDVGKGWQTITTGGKVKGSGVTTAFSQQFQSGITGIQRTVPRDVAIKMQETKLRTMGIPTFAITGTILPQAFADEGENGECVEADAFCGFREFFEGKPAGTYCKCPNWFGWNGKDGNGNGKERGCSECESCPPEKLAIGTCDCGIHCGIDDETGKPKPPEPCPECPPSHVSLGTGSFLDPCRCVPPPSPCDTECTTCDSDKCQECDAWDVPCETCRKKNGTCTTPADECGCSFWDLGCKFQCWWDKYGMIVMIVGGLIGLGIVLWLLRPLFSMIGAFKGGSP